MKDTKSGGQAFPLSYEGPKTFGNPSGRHAEPGMTLRDYFAAKALVALFAGEANPRVGRDVQPYNSSTEHREYTTKEAYALADAMIAARGAA